MPTDFDDILGRWVLADDAEAIARTVEAKPFKPLLAATVTDIAGLALPVMASPKLDGIRCLIVGGEAVSRSLKPIPNAYIRAQLAGLPNLDGELIVGPETAPDVFNISTSAVMSRDGEPDFRFRVFDLHGKVKRFEDRHADVAGICERLGAGPVSVVPHTRILSLDALVAYEARAVAQGYEGIMVRDPRGAYKCGRSTLREGILGKVKRFADAEGTVVGVEELMHNRNEMGRDALGHAERSTAKAGLVGGGTLGALVVASPAWDQEFRIGTGFTAQDRARIWAGDVLGRKVRFRYQPSGVKNAPRFPSFAGFRGDE